MLQNPELLIHNFCTQEFHIIDGLLPLEQCRSLRAIAQEQHAQGLFRRAKIGRSDNSHKNDAIRTDEILWLEGDEVSVAIPFFLAQIQQLTQLLNSALYLGLNEFETHFASYQPGAYYKKHIDQFAAQKTRKVSFVYYLNEDWRAEDGGALILYNRDNQLIHQVLPQENRFICFNGELPHEVALTHQPRYSITGWLKTRSVNVI